MSATTFTPAEIEIAFLNGDCDHLAAALAEKYAVDIVCLGDDDGAWIHALVHDPSSDLYIDINGAHSRDEVDQNWSDWIEWDDIYPMSQVHWGLGERLYEVPVSVGVTAVEERLAERGITLTAR